jgi:hypothetical protein
MWQSHQTSQCVDKGGHMADSYSMRCLTLKWAKKLYPAGHVHSHYLTPVVILWLYNFSSEFWNPFNEKYFEEAGRLGQFHYKKRKTTSTITKAVFISLRNNDHSVVKCKQLKFHMC